MNGASAVESQAKVAELFSVPRVTALLRPGMSLGKGLTFDLRGDADGRSWNFLLAADRREALTRVRAQKPYLVIGSPPCTAFCQLNQRFNYKRMRPEEVQRRMVEGRVLLEFAAQVYRLQLAGGRHFVHEHPLAATSGTSRASRRSAPCRRCRKQQLTSAASASRPGTRAVPWSSSRSRRGSLARRPSC